MTHKQVKFCKSKRSRILKHLFEEYERGNEPKRAILLSYDDVDRMAVESARARLISHLVSKSDDHCPREFASYYRGPTRYVDPPYSVTSHTSSRSSRLSTPKIHKIIPAYPSFIQNPRWCPYSGPPSEQNSETDVTMDQKYNCKCGNCTSRTCPARRPNPCSHKANIMTFCDRYTMTDTCCGHSSRIPSTRKCSDILVPCTTSTVAVRCAQDKLQVHEMYSRKCPPVPILKKCCPGPVHYDCSQKRLISDDFEDEVVRDVEPSKPKYLKCSIDCKDDEVVTRKNIYNEGISDTIADKFPLGPKKATPAPDCSRTSMSSKCYECNDDNFIPHSHRSESKYHYHCTNPPECEYVRDDNLQCTRRSVVVPSPKFICKAYANPCRRCKQLPRCIKLPKKVLTSERVIESCVEKHSKYSMSCRRG